MSTDAQINANRENAQKSTGPVTAEGKAAVAQNALKHGLFAVQDVVPTENQAEFDSMREQMLADLAPVGAMETLLAQRAFSLAWRLKRAETLQAQVTKDMVESHISYEQLNLGRQKPKEPRYAPEYLALGRIAKEDWCGSRLIERFFEYERRIEKSLYKTIAQLRAMQLARLTAQADSAATQHPAQAGDQVNSEKQSQSGADEATRVNLPEVSDADREKLTAIAKRTWGESLPQWVQAGLQRLGVSVEQDQALADRLQPISSPAIQEISETEAVPLSTANL
jgi:hypothetical protein